MFVGPVKGARLFFAGACAKLTERARAAGNARRQLLERGAERNWGHHGARNRIWLATNMHITRARAVKIHNTGNYTRGPSK